MPKAYSIHFIQGNLRTMCGKDRDEVMRVTQLLNEITCLTCLRLAAKELLRDTDKSLTSGK